MKFNQAVEVFGMKFDENSDLSKVRTSPEPKEHNPENKSYRDLTAYIFEHVEDWTHKIEFPIIEETLLQLQKEMGKQPLHKIIVYASKQESPQFNKQDTEFIAKIYQTYFEKVLRSSKLKDVLNGTKKPILREITQNPSDMDIMMDYYNTEMRTISDEADVHAVHISVTAGTQAMNTALMINAIKHIGQKAHILYLPKEQVLLKLQISKTILKQNYVTSIRESVQSYDYYAALELLKNHGEEYLQEKERSTLYSLLSYANNRFSFNFIDAEATLRHVYDTLPRFRDKVGVLLGEIPTLTDSTTDTTSTMLEELYQNMWVLYQRGQYIDFLGRFFRFHEALLKYFVQRKLNVPLTKNEKQVDPKWYDEQTELIAFAENDKTTGSKMLIKGRDLNRHNMKCIIEFYDQHKGTKTTVLAGTQVIENLADLRNKLILAHGWSGCSEVDIFEKIKTDLQITDINDLENKLFELLRTVFIDAFGYSINQNAYNTMNEVIMSIINNVIDE